MMTKEEILQFKERCKAQTNYMRNIGFDTLSADYAKALDAIETLEKEMEEKVSENLQ